MGDSKPFGLGIGPIFEALTSSGIGLTGQQKPFKTLRLAESIYGLKHLEQGFRP
jgi:hypothetical protein